VNKRQNSSAGTIFELNFFRLFKNNSYLLRELIDLPLLPFPPKKMLFKQRLIFLFVALVSVSAVDRTKFRTCNDAGFCRRHRNQATEPEVSDSIMHKVVIHTQFS